MNAAPNLPGNSTTGTPNPLLLCFDAVFRILARVLCLPFPTLCGHVVHQSVYRTAEFGTTPYRQAYDLAYPSERLGQPVLFPEAEALVNSRSLFQPLLDRCRCSGIHFQRPCAP